MIVEIVRKFKDAIAGLEPKQLKKVRFATPTQITNEEKNMARKVRIVSAKRAHGGRELMLP